jgi:2-polyprenyl-3-methyl-5-hydroxy-6-metoxy-1,4-benzoquinol methylase
MSSVQSDYFDVESNQFSTLNIKKPLLSQCLEMEHLKTALCLPKDSNLLDFGCGSGRLTIYLLSQGYNVTAVDISQKSLNNLKTIYINLHQSGWGKLTCKNIIPDKLFDGIIGSDVLHHVNIKQVLPILYKAVKPGGRIAFSEPNALNICWYIFYLINHIPWKVESGILQNTSSNINKILLSNNFKQINIYHHGLFPTRLFNFSASLCKYNGYTISNLYLFKLFSYRLIISAKK